MAVPAIEDSESWQPAQLIPTTGIGGATEQERRATSALLAVLGAVSEFGRTVTAQCGAPVGKIETFIEVGFPLGDKRVIPDGIIRVSRGSRRWTALVEVKTGDNTLDKAQVEAYLDVAKEQGFDAVVTISNEIPTAAGQHPVDADKRRLRRVALHHLSWTALLTMAVVERAHRGVKDPDQAWILGELIRYLQNPRSGALPTVDMGPHWVAVRDAARHGTLRASDKGIAEVAQRWDQLLRYAALMLSRDLGTTVELQLSKREREDPKARLDTLVKSLVGKGRLEGDLRIPDTAGPITVFADLRTRQVGAAMAVAAPREGRPRTRVTWMLRQLKASPPRLVVEATPARSHASMSESLAQAQAQPDLLVDSQQRPPVRFTLTLLGVMGQKRSIGKDGFPATILSVLSEFYESTAQRVKPCAPSAPKVKRDPVPDDDDTRPTSHELVPMAPAVPEVTSVVE